MNPVSLPAYIERRLETAPHYSDRRGFAQLHTELLGPLSPRTLEEWPLVWQLVNGKAMTETRPAITLAWRRFQDARGIAAAGRRRQPEQWRFCESFGHKPKEEGLVVSLTKAFRPARHGRKKRMSCRLNDPPRQARRRETAIAIAGVKTLAAFSTEGVGNGA
jgi:hypothetical protein